MHEASPAEDMGVSITLCIWEVGLIQGPQHRDRMEGGKRRGQEGHRSGCDVEGPKEAWTPSVCRGESWLRSGAGG